MPESTAPAIPSRTSTAQYSYAPLGWDSDMDSYNSNYNHNAITKGDTVWYAAYSRTVRTYTITYVKSSTDGGGTLQTITDIPYGTTVTAASRYTGSTPTTTQGSAEDYPFEGWEPASATVQGNTTFTAKFGSPIDDTEISDSWDTIIANIDNGTYKTKYKIGNYKPLDLGTTYGTINMQIVAIDGDELASGGTAPLSFVAKELLKTTKRMTPGTANIKGWPDTEIRQWLSTTIQPLITEVTHNRINKVKKTYTNYSSQSTEIQNDTLWIPSAHELFSKSSKYETSGITYDTIYKNNSSRIKKINDVGNSYWLRTTAYSNSSYFQHVYTDGSANTEYAANEKGVCLGFCLGKEPETIEDSWDTILSNPNYATDYSIGDTKRIDLGSEGSHLMEIVAIDEDNKADNTGKAGLTWISKTLLKTSKAMNATLKTSDNDSGYTAGGWENSDMRAYLKNTIKPLIPETVRNAIVPVTKVQSIYTGNSRVKNGQTTTDDVWIPSNYEVGLGTTYESTGAVYSSKFTDSTSRIKKSNSGSVSSWVLRSVHNTSNFCIVYDNGTNYYYSAYSNFMVALGFCTN